MERETNEVAAFKQFAEKELKNHLAELNTRYQNEPLASNELKRQAYKVHEKVYNRIRGSNTIAFILRKSVTER